MELTLDDFIIPEVLTVDSDSEDDSARDTDPSPDAPLVTAPANAATASPARASAPPRTRPRRAKATYVNSLHNVQSLHQESSGHPSLTTCFLDDFDHYDELTGGIDHVEDLLADPYIAASVSRHLAPYGPVDTVRLHALTSEAINPEEQALSKFTRRTLMTLPTWNLWDAAMTRQLNQFHDLRMFGTPCQPPSNAIILRPQWAHKIKQDGTRRSRLCGDGSKRAVPQLYEDQDNSSSCLDQPICRLFFALAAARNLVVFGGDARDAYAHSPGSSTPVFLRLDATFRIWYQKKFKVDLKPNDVAPILRALQGHPAAGRLWENHIVAILKKMGFKRTTHADNIYTGEFRSVKVLLIRQVDDFALACPDAPSAQHIYDIIGKALQLPSETAAPFEQQGVLGAFNGHDIDQTLTYTKLSATSYLRQVLKSHNWDKPANNESAAGAKPRPPMFPDTVAPMYFDKTGPHESSPEHAILETLFGFGYRNLLGELLFAYVLCRLDIGYAITLLAKFSIAPSKLHYQALKHLAIYLRHTIDWGIIYWRPSPNKLLPVGTHVLVIPDASIPRVPTSSSLLELVSYVDSAYGNDLRDQHRSTTGYGHCLAGGCVAYRCKTQPIVAQSSTESELVAANACAKVTKFFRYVLTDLENDQKKATTIWEDNDSTIKIVSHNRPTERSRHIMIRYFALQQWCALGEIILKHIPGIINPSDALTKAVGWMLHARHVRFLMGHQGFTMEARSQPAPSPLS